MIEMLLKYTIDLQQNKHLICILVRIVLNYTKLNFVNYLKYFQSQYFQSKDQLNKIYFLINQAMNNITQKIEAQNFSLLNPRLLALRDSLIVQKIENVAEKALNYFKASSKILLDFVKASKIKIGLFIFFCLPCALFLFLIHKNSQQKYRRLNQKQETILKQGLNNQGNTCFINSILQFLFSAVEIRKHFIEKKYQQNQNCHLIKQIFRSMSQGQAVSKRDELLKRLTLKIENMNINYKYPEQADSIHILINFLDELKNQDKYIAQFFMVDYCQHCGCQDASTCQIFIPANLGKCHICGQKNTIKINSPAPQYLLIVNRGQQSIKQEIYFEENTENGQRFKYEMIAAINYEGNGYSGHFKAHRKDQENQWYEFNDSRVSLKGKINLRKIDSALYQLKGQKQKKLKRSQFLQY